MRKYHPAIAIIIGYFISSTLAHILPYIHLSDILAIFIIILGGFIATYLSRTNKARIGLYEGLVYSISTLPLIFISKTGLTFNLVMILASIPILGLIGGLIGKKVRLRSDNENQLGKIANKSDSVEITTRGEKMSNLTIVIIGSILAIIISAILTLIFGKFSMTLWGSFGVFLATTYVGYSIGRDYVTDGAIYGMIVGVISGIMWIIIIIGSFYGISSSQLTGMTMALMMFAIIYGIIGAIGGLIGGFITHWKNPKEEKHIS